MFIIFIILATIVGGTVMLFSQGKKEGELAQADSEGYVISDIPKSPVEVKRIINAQFGSFFWSNVSGPDEGIYKQLKLMGKLAGLGPTIGILIEPSEADPKKTNVEIIMVDYNTITQLLFVTTYPGVKKAHKTIDKVRQVLGDPTVGVVEE